jgi:lysophospholipase
MNQYNKKVLPFYKSCEQGFFFGSENKRINYLKYEAERKDTAVILLPGKSESYIKYAELIYDLKSPGMSFFLMDHRGMGFSERILEDNPDKVFVENFDDYTNDLKKFMEKVVVRERYNKLFLISHSMGGLIAALYLETFPDDFDGAIFSTPMMEINTGIIPERAVQEITSFFIFLGMGKNYSFSQGKRKPRNFKNNKLTSSKNRWTLWEDKLLFEYPEIISGGVTNRWLNESLKACRKALNNRHQIKVPILILKGEKDDVVKKEGINILCETTACKKVIFADAKHELFMEKDSIRDLALQQILDFINEGRSKK